KEPSQPRHAVRAGSREEVEAGRCKALSPRGVPCRHGGCGSGEKRGADRTGDGITAVGDYPATSQTARRRRAEPVGTHEPRESRSGGRLQRIEHPYEMPGVPDVLILAPTDSSVDIPAHQLVHAIARLAHRADDKALAFHLAAMFVDELHLHMGAPAGPGTAKHAHPRFRGIEAA